MTLTKRDFQELHKLLAGPLMTYLSYAETGGLKPGLEMERLEYLKGLSDRLDAAEAAAPVS